MARYNDGFAKMELQTIATAFDNGTMTVSTAKSRVFGYLGIDIKARTKKGFLKELANYVYSEPKQNPAPKRKTSARTQKAAVGYVNRPSQITKKAPSKRLKKRRTINLQSPRGVFPNPKPRYSGAMDITYPTYAAFSKDAKACGYDPKKLIQSGEYFKEPDGHVLSKKFATKKNPVKRQTHYETTVQSSMDKKHWTIFARFPDTPEGAANAIEYAKAYAVKEPWSFIRVEKTRFYSDGAKAK